MAHGMPKIEDAMRPSAQKPRAIHNVGLVLQKRTQQDRIFRWIVFQIPVLNDDEIARRLLNTASQRRPLPYILGLKKNFYLRGATLNLAHKPAPAFLRLAFPAAHTNPLRPPH